VCCFAVQVQSYLYADTIDIKLPGIGVPTTLAHLRPKPPKKDSSWTFVPSELCTYRRYKDPATVFAPVAEEQPHREDEEEGAKFGGGDDDKDEGGQTGERTRWVRSPVSPVGSQSLM